VSQNACYMQYVSKNVYDESSSHCTPYFVITSGVHCKPTFFSDYFILRFFCDKLVCGEQFSWWSLPQHEMKSNNWFAMRNIHDDGVLAIFVKYSCMRRKVGLCWFIVFSSPSWLSKNVLIKNSWHFIVSVKITTNLCRTMESSFGSEIILYKTYYKPLDKVWCNLCDQGEHCSQRASGNSHILLIFECVGTWHLNYAVNDFFGDG
jgi:hypothetical protein